MLVNQTLFSNKSHKAPGISDFEQKYKLEKQMTQKISKTAVRQTTQQFWPIAKKKNHEVRFLRFRSNELTYRRWRLVGVIHLSSVDKPTFVSFFA